MELFCPEDGSLLAFSDEDDETNELFIFSNCTFLSEADDEYIEALVSKETTFFNSNHPLSGDRLHCERFESVRWILKVNSPLSISHCNNPCIKKSYLFLSALFQMKSCFGFSSQTAYLAVTFLDRFLLRRTIDEGKIWAMKLLSIACLSLAAKMEECAPPFLPEYRFEGYRFSSKVIQRMELLALDTLEWKLKSVTPFTYLSYFASRFHFDNCSSKLLPKAVGFIFLVVKAMNLIDYRPSTIAAAAILAASGEESTKKLFETNNGAVSLPEPSEREHVFACYDAMIHESLKEKTRSKCAKQSHLNDFIASNKKRRLQAPDG